MTLDSQAGLFPERSDQGDTALHGFEAPRGTKRKITENKKADLRRLFVSL
ncbi:MAG TPA: hypothetical protein VM571_00230 [Noviherbaspirillum sp.]|nr:hypothetical protein [Noviherbaspirillum sp.]